MRERIATYLHDLWCRWITELFVQSQSNDDGSVTLPVELVTKWSWQASTEYDGLTEDEKNSLRVEADEILRPESEAASSDEEKGCKLRGTNKREDRDGLLPEVKLGLRDVRNRCYFVHAYYINDKGLARPVAFFHVNDKKEIKVEQVPYRTDVRLLGKAVELIIADVGA